MIGKKLGHYEVQAAIGKGGMGEVYSAIDTTLGRQVAIKTLPSEFEKDPKRLARFEREAKLLATLNHPNIATIYGLERDGDSSFIVLELIEGETLAARLATRRLPVEESLRLALQIAEAIEAAHAKGVVHRDLKPANVKITPDDQVKVLDFGLAKALSADEANPDGHSSLTISVPATGRVLVLGTPGYMSPEQARGDLAGHQADVWAFGVVLFEMLSGQAAFSGSTVTDIQAAVLKTEPDWNALPNRLHPRVRMLLERCLAKDVRQRYAGIADARVDLQVALADPRGVMPREDRVRSRFAAMPWIVALLAATVGTVAWIIRPAPEPVVVQFDVETFGALPEEGAAIALSPDLRRLVYPADNRLYLRNLDRADDAAAPIPGTENGANPFFSPDSQWVGFFTGSSLFKVNLASNELVRIADISDGWSGEWSSDGRIFFGQIGESGIWSVPEAGGLARELIPLGDRLDLDHPEVLPDSRWLLVFERLSGEAIFASTRVVAVASDGSGEPRVVLDAVDTPRYMPRYSPTGHLAYVANGALWIVGFDPERLEVTTDPFRIIDAVSASANGPRASYSIAEDGSIAFIAPPPAADPPGLLALIDTEDGSREYLGLGPARYRNPRFSPDGSRILFETIEQDGRAAVWVFEPGAETEPERLTIAGSNTRPLWQDDEWIIYASDREGPLAIFRQSIVTGETVRLLQPVNENGDCPASWDPGRRLLFLSRQGCLVADSWMIAVDPDGSVVSMDPLPNVGYGAELSPNSAYLASFPGPAQIEVRRFPVTEDVWPVGNGGAYPIWSANGQSIVYRRASQVPDRPAALDQLVRIRVSTASSFGQLEEEALPIDGFTPNFGYRDYDFAPDGRLLMVVHADPGYTPPEPGITVIVNWGEILKERVPLR